MSRDHDFFRIRVLSDVLVAQQNIQLRSELTKWNNWLQKASMQQNTSEDEQKKKDEQEKQIDKKIERENVTHQAALKAQEYSYVILLTQQNKQQLTALRKEEENGLRNHPFSFWSQRIKRYRDWLENKPNQHPQTAKSNEKESAESRPAKQAKTTHYKATETNKHASILQQYQQLRRKTLNDENKAENKKEDKQELNQRKDAGQTQRQSDQSTQLGKKQRRELNKTEALTELKESKELATTSESDQALSSQENEEELAESKEAPEQQNVQVLSTQQDTAQQATHSALSAETGQLSGVQSRTISQPKKVSARPAANAKDEINNELEEEKAGNDIAKLTEQNQENANDSHAQSTPYSQEPVSALSKVSSIDKLTGEEFLSRTLAQLIEAVTKFSCNRAVNALGDWELTIDLDTTLLPYTTLIMGISDSELLLRFTSTDPAANILISRYSKTLHYKLTKYMKQYDYPRTVKIELNSVLL